MATKAISNKTWVSLKRITVKITECSDTGIYCRVFGMVKLGKIEHEYDMFPLNNDFFVSINGTLNISETENGLKMKVKVEIL
jgi:hypothetical protein